MDLKEKKYIYFLDFNPSFALFLQSTGNIYLTMSLEMQPEMEKKHSLVE